MPLPELETKSLVFKDFNSLDKKKKGMFEGVLAGFGNEDSHGDRILKGSIDKSLADWNRKGQLPLVLWSHDDDEPVGNHLEARTEGDDFYVKGVINIDNGLPPTEATIKSYNVMAGNGPKSMSIGFWKHNAVATKNKVGGRDFSQIDWAEGSVLPYGANERARILSVKSRFVGDDGQPIDIRTLEQLLRDGGMSQRQAKAFLADGYRGLQRDAAALVYDEATVRDLADRAQRIKQSMSDFNLNTTNA